MLTVRSEEFVRYEDGKAVVRAVLEVASPEELPAADGLSGRLLHQGSLAWDIVNGTLYGLTAEGEWYAQALSGGSVLSDFAQLFTAAGTPIIGDFEEAE